MNATSTCISKPNAVARARTKGVAGAHRLLRDRALARETVRVEPGHGVSLADAAGVQVVCLQGRLWLTLEGDARDITLGAGDAHTIERNGLTLVTAFEPSRLSVRAQWDRRYARWPRWLRLLASWLVNVGEARARRHRLSRYY